MDLGFQDVYKVNNGSYSAMVIGSGTSLKDQSTLALFWHAKLSLVNMDNKEAILFE